MVASKLSIDRKEKIVSAAIERLFAVGFEGFRIADVAKDVGINNATLIHHYPSKVALIRAVVENFTERFKSVADATNIDGSPRTKLARHMRSSMDLMRTSPEMFVVLNEIMLKARRDVEIAQLVSVPLSEWKEHIVSLLLSSKDEGRSPARHEAQEIATACMAQLLGMGLLLNSTDQASLPFEPSRDRAGSWAIVALTYLVEDAS